MSGLVYSPSSIVKVWEAPVVVCGLLLKLTGSHIYYCSYPENGVIPLLARDVRPRARTVYQWHQLESGMVVMVNYNPDDPKERGYWYDAEIQRKRETRTVREIYAKIILG